MNEATADNNGVYLLDGRHGNGCRQSERERERESKRHRVQVYSSAVWISTLVLHFFSLHVTFSISLPAKTDCFNPKLCAHFHPEPFTFGVKLLYNRPDALLHQTFT